MLSAALLQGESPDLWNDWAVVQLSVAERALRRALLLNPAHSDASANLGVLLAQENATMPPSSCAKPSASPPAPRKLTCRPCSI
ncbi:MAG: hypothetical protein WB470_25410, partial [Candidatus Acidiferrales bacterium]